MNTTLPTMRQVESLPWNFPAIVAAATVYRASTGRRRAYQSERDAQAYDEGYASFPTRPPVYLKSPFADGFWDAESAHLDSHPEDDEVDL